MATLHPGDCHAFEAAGRRFVYLAPSAAVLAVDDVSAAVLDTVAERPRSAQEIRDDLTSRFDASDVDESVDELVRLRALTKMDAPVRRPPKILPLTPVPLSTMVMNVT